MNFYVSCVNGSPYSCGVNYDGSNVPALCSCCVYKRVAFVFFCLYGLVKEHIMRKGEVNDFNA